MANTLVLAQVVAREALAILRNNSNRMSTVFRGLDLEWQQSARKPGESVYVRVPPTLAARDVATDLAGAGLVTQNVTESSVAVTMDKNKYTQVQITEKEATLSLDVQSLPALRERVLLPQIVPLIDQIESDLQGLYVDIPYYTGTAGTTPSALDDIANAGAILTTNKAPLTPNRVMDLNPSAYAKMWPLMAQLRTANPENDALRAAYVGTVGGFDTFQSQLVPTHTKGDLAATATLTLAGAGTTGALAIGGNAKTIKKGDLFTIADVAGQYVCTEDETTAADGTGELKFYPATPGAVAGKVITIVANHTANMGYTKNAFCLAMARQEAPLGGAVGAVETDPVTGMSVLVVYDWANMANILNVSVLYGVKTLRREEAVRLLG